ncbi:hypothetical protein SISSUDRAFT_1125116 [Sistotremastrum suecicum HHB10207 ss-3]|uniref:Uncharacterized protein n=1 Tax=Sistotremastrum suecicum HHB10207 ss-3 TaxID=1314776 RepID=A0A166HZQ4_9AGAM|nr:hypothetical protein SISSUDRAFT_1125116 [Sistotremastrum suecicum HHB10207 ss-3]
MSSTQQTTSKVPFWGHLLPTPISQNLSQNKAKETQHQIPFTPSDRGAVTLRIVLQDTQRTIEKFSEKVDALISHVGQTKQAADASVKRLEECGEKTIMGITDVVKHCHDGTLEAIGKPLQVETFDTFVERQGALGQSIHTLDKKIESIEHKFDILQTKIQFVANQQTQVLAALSAVATLSSVFPILQAMPHHEHADAAEIRNQVEKEREATAARHREQRRSHTPSPRKRPEKRKRRESLSVERQENSPLRFDTAIQTTPSPSPRKKQRKVLSDLTNLLPIILDVDSTNNATTSNELPLPLAEAIPSLLNTDRAQYHTHTTETNIPEIFPTVLPRRASISNVTDYDSPPERPVFQKLPVPSASSGPTTPPSAKPDRPLIPLKAPGPKSMNLYPQTEPTSSLTAPKSSLRASSPIPSSETIAPPELNPPAPRSMFSQLNVPYSDEADIVFNPEDFLDDLSTQDELYSDD